MARQRNKRMMHAVDIYRDPTGAKDAHGGQIGLPILVAAKVPCSIVTLTGRQAEQARSTWAYAGYQIEMFGDPAWAIAPGDKLIQGEKVYYVGHVDDVDQKGVEFVLLCGREIAEVADGNG
jgi:head-tail joining protein